MGTSGQVVKVHEISCVVRLPGEKETGPACAQVFLIYTFATKAASRTIIIASSIPVRNVIILIGIVIAFDAITGGPGSVIHNVRVLRLDNMQSLHVVLLH